MLRLLAFSDIVFCFAIIVHCKTSVFHEVSISSSQSAEHGQPGGVGEVQRPGLHVGLAAELGGGEDAPAAEPPPGHGPRLHLLLPADGPVAGAALRRQLPGSR